MGPAYFLPHLQVFPPSFTKYFLPHLQSISSFICMQICLVGKTFKRGLANIFLLGVSMYFCLYVKGISLRSLIFLTQRSCFGVINSLKFYPSRIFYRSHLLKEKRLSTKKLSYIIATVKSTRGLGPIVILGFIPHRKYVVESEMVRK